MKPKVLSGEKAFGFEPVEAFRPFIISLCDGAAIFKTSAGRASKGVERGVFLCALLKAFTTLSVYTLSSSLSCAHVATHVIQKT